MSERAFNLPPYHAFAYIKSVEDLAAYVAEHVAFERERCAAVAERMGRTLREPAVAGAIADAIRSPAHAHGRE